MKPFPSKWKRLKTVSVVDLYRDLEPRCEELRFYRMAFLQQIGFYMSGKKWERVPLDVAIAMTAIAETGGAKAVLRYAAQYCVSVLGPEDRSFLKIAGAYGPDPEY